MYVGTKLSQGNPSYIHIQVNKPTFGPQLKDWTFWYYQIYHIKNEKMPLTNSAFADQGLTGSILGRRIGQMDCGGKQIYWYRCNLGQKSSYWCYTAIPEGGGGLGWWVGGWEMGRVKHFFSSEKTWNMMKTLSSENLEYDGNMDSFLTFVIFALLLWIQYLNEQMFFFVTVMSEIFEILQTNIILKISVKHCWIVWNSNCFTEREREFMNNLLSYLYMHGQRRNGRKFCPEKVKYSKGEMWINIVDVLWKIYPDLNTYIQTLQVFLDIQQYSGSLYL